MTPVTWATAARTLPGQQRSGDISVTQDFDGGIVLAVIDGLGHGDVAAEAAAAAAVEVRRLAGSPLAEIFAACDASMQRARGVVMSVATVHVHARTLTWAGLGNVEGVILHADSARPREGLLSIGGVLGSGRPRVREKTLPLTPGDLLLFATDGVRTGFARSVDVRAPVAAIAQGILARGQRDDDDALVLVARWEGATA